MIKNTQTKNYELWIVYKSDVQQFIHLLKKCNKKLIGCYCWLNSIKCVNIIYTYIHPNITTLIAMHTLLFIIAIDIEIKADFIEIEPCLV